MSQIVDNVDFVNGNVQDIANAYYQRDVQMNLDFQQVKNHALRKLGYTQDSIQRIVLNRFARHINDIVGQYNQNVMFNDNQFSVANVNNLPNMYNISIHQMFEDFRNTELINNLVNRHLDRGNVLTNIDNHSEFYNHMTREELGYLGW
jgi:hypothetical protein